MTDKYQSRIEYQGDLSPKLAEVTDAFNLGEYQSHAVIPVGYEDLNLRLTAGDDDYFVKMFAASRTQADIDRYVGIIEAVLDAGVRHPALLPYGSGQHLYRLHDTPVQLLVMEWLDGKSYWDLGQKPTKVERAELIRSAAQLNALTFRPDFIYDSWAMNNFGAEYQANGHYLSAEDDAAVSAALEAFEAIDHDSLPHGLVHGDLISSNVIKTSKGLYLFDFSVANYLPRIQELAILMCDLFFDASDTGNTQSLCDEAIQEYQKHTPLQQIEIDALPAYARAAHAMFVLQPSKFIAEGDDNSENAHWLNLGRAGLHL